MQWPTLIVDDFFTDPHRVVKLSKTFKYTPAPDNSWPGTRTLQMHEIDMQFFKWSTLKIMALLYPTQIVLEGGVNWEATQYFQRVPYNTYGKEGWVHDDRIYEFTSIIYLSDNPNSGTCLYEGKHFVTQAEYLEEKERFHRDLKGLQRMEKYRNKNNSRFRKKVELVSNFNRLVLFDGHAWHASRNDASDKKDRLTLITFFKNITGKDIRYPVTQMKRI